MNLFDRKIMMIRLSICIVLLSFICNTQAQNLVPNCSFEDTVHCPTGPYYGMSCAMYWISPTPDSPDYYNACSPWWNVPGGSFGWFQYAKSGVAYAGVFVWSKENLNDREYIQVKLSDSLIKNKWYCAGFWISKDELGNYAVRNIGMFISKNPVGSSTITNLPYTPQISYTGIDYLTDTVNWVLISGSFQAQGGEKYITIGNFDNDNDTDTLMCDTTSGTEPISYYLIDAVFLYDCSESVQAYAGEDASICGEETAQLGTIQINGCHYKWTPNIGLDNDTLANPTAKPSQTTTYVLSMTDPYYQITTDTVIVEVTNDCNKIDFIPNIFTPNRDGFNDVFKVKGENIASLKLLVYNRWGNLVFEGNEPDAAWNGKFKGQDCDAGVYYYVAEVGFKNGTTDNRNGCVTLLR